MFSENAVEYLRNSECYSFQTFTIVFSTPENLLVGISGALGNERKPLSKLKHVFRKCSGVSQKWWMLELSNLCHCVQHPWKLTSRYYWSSRNKRKPLSKLKHVSENAVEYLRNSECYSFQIFAIVFSTPENLLVGITGALGMKESHFLC